MALKSVKTQNVEFKSNCCKIIMPFNPKFTITSKINKALVEIERVRGFLDAVKLKDDWIADMQKNVILLSVV